MKPYLTILAGLLLSYAPYAKAQNHPQLINSREIITEGIDYYQNEKYDSAMHFFNLISRYDTNYAWATYEKALTLASLEKHHEAIEMAKFGLTLEPMELLNYNIIGSSYDALEEYQKAYDTYNEALKKFPYNHDLLFNKAVCYQLWDEKKKSIEQHFENLDIIPYSGSTHLRLALLAEKEGLATQAMLSFALFLVIEPDGGRSFSILNEMNKLGQLSSEIYKSEQDSKIPSEFEKQDLIFDNKIPLNDKYKVPSKYNFAFIKQLYAIFDFIKKDKNLKDGLWTDFYTPIFKDIANTVDFENFSLLLLASATEETIAKEVQKHLSKIIDTRNQILDIVYKHNNTIELTIDGKSKEFSKYFTTQRRLDAIGNKSKDDLKEGKW